VSAEPLAGLIADLAKLKIGAVVLARVAVKLPTDLLDDARIAATDELALRGYHVITHRSRRSAYWERRHGA